MNHVVIDALLVATPPSLTVRNFREDGEPRFHHVPRRKPLAHLVLHETAGTTAAGAKARFVRTNLGAHLIVDRDGTVSAHADLRRDVCWHANHLNGTSIGIEVVNPYAPSLAGKLPVDTIPARWWTWCPVRTDRRYVLPTPAQIAALRVLVPWCCATLGIPVAWPTMGLGPAQPKIPGWDATPRAVPPPGILAHRDFWKHADGRYLLEDLHDYLEATNGQKKITE